MTYAKPLAALAVAGSLLATGPLALAGVAAAAPKGGAIRLFASQVTPIKSNTTITGAIADYGTGISQDKNGKPDANGNYEKLVLKHGTVLVDVTGLAKALQAHGKVQLNKSNCSFVFSGTGPGKIESGTGAYAGISGTITITLTTAALEPSKGSGCNLSAPGKGVFESVVGTGSVSFS